MAPFTSSTLCQLGEWEINFSTVSKISRRIQFYIWKQRWHTVLEFCNVTGIIEQGKNACLHTPSHSLTLSPKIFSLLPSFTWSLKWLGQYFALSSVFYIQTLMNHLLNEKSDDMCFISLYLLYLLDVFPTFTHIQEVIFSTLLFYCWATIWYT